MTDAGGVSSAEAKRIGSVIRFRFGNILTVPRREILHLKRPSYLLLEALENIFSGLLPVDGSESIAIPVVVKPEAARRVATARRSLTLDIRGFVGRWMVNSERDMRRSRTVVCLSASVRLGDLSSIPSSARLICKINAPVRNGDAVESDQ